MKGVDNGLMIRDNNTSNQRAANGQETDRGRDTTPQVAAGASVGTPGGIDAGIAGAALRALRAEGLPRRTRGEARPVPLRLGFPRPADQVGLCAAALGRRGAPMGRKRAGRAARHRRNHKAQRRVAAPGPRRRPKASRTACGALTALLEARLRELRITIRRNRAVLSYSVLC